METLTHSRMSSAKTCLRKHFFRYENGIRKLYEGEALIIGREIHDAIDKGEVPVVPDPPADMTDSEALDAYFVTWAKIRGLVEGYLEFWSDDNCEILASEIEFEMPIINPESGRSSRTFNARGKIDRIVKLPDGRVAILELKTTSENLDRGSDYWRRLQLDQQISLYWIGAKSLGHEIQTILYDVIRKPSIRPKLIGKGDDKHRETAEEYRERLVADINERPEFYFARDEVPRLQSDIEEFQQELWDQSKVLNECQKNGFWYRNTNACLHPFRCEYFDICHMDFKEGDPLPEGFVRAERQHEELS